MRPLNARKPSLDRGYTLLEILVALSIAGLITALTFPNVLAWLNRNKIQTATDIVQAALEDAQRQAIRQGRNCTLLLSGAMGSSPRAYNGFTTDRTGCLAATGDTPNQISLPSDVRMVTNFPTINTAPGVQFSFQGHATAPSPGLTFDPPANQPIIVVYSPQPNSTTPYPNQLQRCVVISSLLGTISTGMYTGSLTTLDATQCQAYIPGVQTSY